MPRLRERYSLAQFQQRFATEEACLDHLEQARWPYGPVCPRCGVIGESSRLTARPRVRQCSACRKQFSVTAHTPMHKTHLPLSVWFTALYLLTQSSKGISALKLSVLLGLQYRTTWHLYHRIRQMMQEADPLLTDVIELDETYAGSPPRKIPAGAPPAPPGPTGRGTRRPLLLVASQRGGPVLVKRIASHSREAIDAALAGCIHPAATLITDGLPAYAHLSTTHPHLTVCHSRREFARTDAASGIRVHVNTAEAFNGHFRRTITGVFHRISAEHLERYACEAAWRWNHRLEFFLDRLAHLLACTAGALPYQVLVA